MSLRRIAQFVGAVRCKDDPAVDARLRVLLGNDAQWALLQRLAPFDRAHHLRVHELLVTLGHDDLDLLRAALLHDIGKADERGRVRLPHRVVSTLLGELAPSLLARLSRADRDGVRHGLYLAAHHARLGAELAAQAGASARCCALIAGHEGAQVGDDPLLAALIAADSQAIA
jgi:putative nucleotidyltransferase with HDIG domain